MKTIATHERRTFLKDHPPVIQRMLLHSTGAEQDLIAGTVLGEKDGKCGEFTSGAEALGILVEDTTIPAAGDVYGAHLGHWRYRHRTKNRSCGAARQGHLRK